MRSTPNIRKPLYLQCITAVLGMYLASTVLAADADWPDLPDIKIFNGMQVEWVAKKMRYNGLPMSMQSFFADQSADELLQRYHDYWSTRAGSQVSRSKSGNADVIGVELGRYFYSVQALPADEQSSYGTLSVSLSPKLLRKQRVESTEFLLPADAKTVNRIEALDGAKLSETITFFTDRDSRSAARWYQSRMPEDGWVLLNKTDAEGVQLYFQKNSEHAMVNIVDKKSKFGDTAVQINWVKN